MSPYLEHYAPSIRRCAHTEAAALLAQLGDRAPTVAELVALVMSSHANGIDAKDACEARHRHAETIGAPT